MAGNGNGTGTPWGGDYERKRAKEREELLAKLPEELREAAEQLLAESEKDFQIWSYTMAAMALGSVLKRGGAESARSEQHIDVLLQTLKFYRLAVLTDSAKFWCKQLGEEEASEELVTLLARSANRGLQKTKESAARLEMLLEALEEEGESSGEVLGEEQLK